MVNIPNMRALIFLLFLCIQSVIALPPHSNIGKKNDPSLNPTTDKNNRYVAVLNITNNMTDHVDKKVPAITNNSFKNTEVESGALMRGVYVFVAFTVIFLMYLGVKTYRNRWKPNVIVRKYGVRTRRSDLEMEPLPLDDNDEDDTVFDVGLLNRQ